MAAALGRDARSSAATRPASPGLFLVGGLFLGRSLRGADFAIDVVGTMMWAYGVPFASSQLTSVGRIMMCGPLTTHWFVGRCLVAYGSVLLAPLSRRRRWSAPGPSA